MKESVPGTWKHLICKNIDFIIALLITILIYLISFIMDSRVEFNYVFFASIFLGIFIVNFTVFAISKFLVENYHKVRNRLKKDIDATFRTPMNTSVVGIILSLIFIVLKNSFLSFLNPLVIFLLIYSITSSYFVFEFLYKISLRRVKNP